MVDTDDEEDLGLFPVESISFSVDTQWYFEGAWLALVSFVDEEYPTMTLGEAMASEDDDGHLGDDDGIVLQSKSNEQLARFSTRFLLSFKLVPV